MCVCVCVVRVYAPPSPRRLNARGLSLLKRVCRCLGQPLFGEGDGEGKGESDGEVR